MKFHAIVEYPGGSRGWKNHSRESLLKKVVIPFVQGQIITVGAPHYNTILNMNLNPA
jgi:hypothetical protein